jgi:SAM-dependent methyltransferase
LAQLYRAADDEIYEAEIPNRWRTANRHRRIVEQYMSIKGSLLDIGSASGAFMRVMQDAGWRVMGIEPSESQNRRAMALLGGDAVIQQSVLETARISETFDLITMWDVLEHVIDPPQFLSLAASHLKDDGYLMLNVPRIDSLQARLFGDRWPLLVAEHLCYFTVPSLIACGDAAGLKLVRTGTRPVAFSLGYVFFRAGQHRIPGAHAMLRLLRMFRFESRSIPLWTGEVYAVFRKQAAEVARQPMTAPTSTTNSHGG